MERQHLKTIIIKNLSTFTDYAAVGRVARLLAGDNYYASHDEHGNEVARIVGKGNEYTVLDKKERD